MSSIPEATSEESQHTQKEVIHRLSSFADQTRKAGPLFGLYGILSIVLGLVCILSTRPLLFGAAIPVFLCGLVIVRLGGRLWWLGKLMRSQLNAGNVLKSSMHQHLDRISHEISQLRRTRTAATFIFSIGVCILVLACVFTWPDSIIGLSLGIVIQFAILGVMAMMTNFWLEIHSNEVERHRN